jgi:hypothetical protein
MQSEVATSLTAAKFFDAAAASIRPGQQPKDAMALCGIVQRFGEDESP